MNRRSDKGPLDTGKTPKPPTLEQDLQTERDTKQLQSRRLVRLFSGDIIHPFAVVVRFCVVALCFVCLFCLFSCLLAFVIFFCLFEVDLRLHRSCIIAVVSRLCVVVLLFVVILYLLGVVLEF